MHADAKVNRPKTQTAVLARGCFWGIEELSRTRPGVVDTKIGYTGGSTPIYPAESHHPDYLQKHPGGYTCHFERTAQPLEKYVG